MIWWSTLVKSTVRQVLAHTSNNILSPADHHCALARADADDTYPCWGVISAKEDDFVVASCFLWSVPHELAPVASCFWECSETGDRFWGTAKPLCPQQNIKLQHIFSLQLLPELPLSSPSLIDDMACLWDELKASLHPRVPSSTCSTESSVQQRTTSVTDPLWHPQVPRCFVTQHVPCQVAGKCMWEGEACYGMVAKHIKEGEVKSHFKQNTAQGTSVFLKDRLGPSGQPADSNSITLFQGKKC